MRRQQNVSPYASDTWNYREGDRIRVVCCTNASTARLLLNGQPVGGEARRDPGTEILYWDIDYHPGTLRCETGNGASYEIRTFKKPHALRLTTDSVAHVFIEVVDDDGNVVKSADNEVSLQVRGARLLGMENGNIMDSSINGRRQSNRLRVQNGSLVAYIQPQRENGPTTIRATSSFLEAAELTIMPK